MEEEQEYDMDQELSQWGEATKKDLGLWEEVMTVQECNQQQEEVSLCGDVRPQELSWHQCEVGETVQWGDGTQQEPEVSHWEESGTVQEVYQWDQEDETCQELNELEEGLTYQELPLWEGEGHQELYPLEDVGAHMLMYQWEGDEREPELSQEGNNREKELIQTKDYNVQHLTQWEKDGSNPNQSQREESVSSQGLCQWRKSVRYRIYDKPLHPEKDKDAQPCAQQGPSSPSNVGTPVAAEAARELPSSFPALRSPTKDELAAAAALAGAAEEVEEPLEPLAPEVEEAPGSPAHSEELPLAGTESPLPAPCSPPGYSQALLDLAGHISSEVVLKAVLEVQASGQQPEEQGDLENSMAAELEAATPGQKEESPSSAPPSPSPIPLGAQELREQQEEADRGSVLAEEESECGALAGELEHSQSKELSQGEINKNQEGSQGEICTEQELSQAEASSFCTEQELSQAEASSSQEGAQSKGFREEELPQAEADSHQEGSQGKGSIGQELSAAKASNNQEGSQGEGSIEQKLSATESGSHQEGSQGKGSTEQELSSAESGSHQEGFQGEGSTEWELSSAESDSHQEGFQGEGSTEQELSPAETSSYHKGSQGEACNEQELPLEEAGSHPELSDWEECVEEELSHGDVGNYQEVSDWEEGTEKHPSQGQVEGTEQGLSQVSSTHNLSDWEEYSEHELSHGDVSSCQEVSDWEDSIGQGMSRRNSKRPSVESSWASDSDRDLTQDSWEQSIRAKPLLQEDDEWDEISVLELCEDKDRERRPAGLTGGRLFLHVPRQAWAELGASGQCFGELLCASSPPVEALAPRGHTASPAFQKQVPETETPQTLRSLRSLFCFPCLAPRPED
ncbi:unnamed protein product [Coccothraustes coccothraustes]